ncbi:MAG: ATP-binding cassette domain-containing protein [Candidatus Asgardarchaeia archaeon]
MEIIEASNLTKKYNGFLAVDHISFSVKKGEIFSFLGPNGAGKTTTIYMLTTLIKITEGEAYVNGYNVETDSDKVRESIGVVFQEMTVDRRLTGRENLELHGRLYGIPKFELKRRIDELLDFVELKDKQNVLVSKYSGGMVRRLEIARGLLQDPEVLFLDEPTLGLDVQTRFHIWRYIKELNKEMGITIFLTTHYLEEADRLSDRVAIIDHGRIVAIDSPEALKNRLSEDIVILKVMGNVGAKMVGELNRFDFVENVKVLGKDLIRISLKNGAYSIPKLFEILNGMNVKVERIEYRKPTLDDVFLQLTGKSLRESTDKIMSLLRHRMRFARR